jgi:hypothetical protein
MAVAAAAVAAWRCYAHSVWYTYERFIAGYCWARASGYTTATTAAAHDLPDAASTLDNSANSRWHLYRRSCTDYGATDAEACSLDLLAAHYQ